MVQYPNLAPTRITPARAGKTDQDTGYAIPERDHPRSCGKDPMRCDSDGLSLGSPPLVRERHAKKLSVRSSSGITPARAGKTQMLLNSAALYEDHPRSCGKDNQAYEIIHEIGGSPPLVRERLGCSAR